MDPPTKKNICWGALYKYTKGPLPEEGELMLRQDLAFNKRLSAGKILWGFEL